MTARGLLEGLPVLIQAKASELGRGPNRRFGRDSVFKSYFFSPLNVGNLCYFTIEPATIFATKALSLVTLPLSAG